MIQLDYNEMDNIYKPADIITLTTNDSILHTRTVFDIKGKRYIKNVKTSLKKKSEKEPVLNLTKLDDLVIPIKAIHDTQTIHTNEDDLQMLKGVY